MATFYSDHFEPSGGTSVSTRDRTHIPPAGKAGGQEKRYSGYIKALATTSDVMRILKGVPSGARVHEIWVSADDASAAGAFNLGAYDTEDNGGAIIDVNRFGAALSKNAARVDGFAGDINKMDRGKFLWQLLGLTSDPMKPIDICATPSTTFTTTAIGILVEMVVGQP